MNGINIQKYNDKSIYPQTQQVYREWKDGADLKLPTEEYLTKLHKNDVKLIPETESADVHPNKWKEEVNHMEKESVPDEFDLHPKVPHTFLNFANYFVDLQRIYGRR